MQVYLKKWSVHVCMVKLIIFTQMKYFRLGGGSQNTPAPNAFSCESAKPFFCSFFSNKHPKYERKVSAWRALKGHSSNSTCPSQFIRHSEKKKKKIPIKMWRRAKQMTGSLCFPVYLNVIDFFFFLKCVTLEEVVPPKPRSAPESKLMSARPLLPQTSPIARHPGKRTTTNLVFMIGDTEKKTIFIPVRQFYVTSG